MRSETCEWNQPALHRGPVKNLAEVHGHNFDAVILPGGFGAAKNLCSFATKGAECEVHPDVARVLKEAHGSGRPIGLICISPAIGAKVFPGCMVTIGVDESTASTLENIGCLSSGTAHGRHLRGFGKSDRLHPGVYDRTHFAGLRGNRKAGG